MAKPRKLSTHEVAALVGGLIEMDQTGSQDAGAEFRPYAFGSGDTSQVSDYYGLRMINERFCRIARSAFVDMLRFHPRISAFPPEVRSFDDYRSSQENFMSITQSRIDELRGSQMLVVPPSFIWMLTDAYYGGAVRQIKSSRTEFTGTEQRVIEIVSDRLNVSLAQAWRDMLDLHFTVQGREENMQFAAFLDGEEHVVNCAFMVQLPGQEPQSFDILYPLQTLKPISALLRSRLQSDIVDEDDAWRDRLHRAIQTIPLTVTARLAQIDLPLGQLLQINPGDTLPVSLTETIDISVEGTPLCRARPGEVRGHAAISLTQPLVAVPSEERNPT